MHEASQQEVWSPLIIGTMRLGKWGVQMDRKTLAYFIDECLDLGLKDFDHADIYGHYTTESDFGEVIKNRPDLKNKVRVTTKCGIKMICDNRPNHRIKSYDSSKEHIIASAENSLDALGMDCIDLLLLHRPDYLMQPAEIAAAFEQLKQQGKVKAFGVSNFSAAQLDLLHSYTPLLNHQIEVSLLHLDAFENGTLDQCLKLGIAPSAWSPFGGGSIFSDSDDPQIQRIQRVTNQLAQRYEATSDQILLAWLLKHPASILPVLGTSKISRIKNAMAALRIQLSREEWYELWQAAIGTEVA